jgi:hypothetical protein
MNFFDDNDNNDEKTKFLISGMEDNIEIEEDPKTEGNKTFEEKFKNKSVESMISEIAEAFNVTEDELNYAMEEFSKILHDESDPDFLNKLQDHVNISTSPGNKEEKHFFLDNIALQMILDKFLGGNHTLDLSKSMPNVNNLFDNNVDSLLEKMKKDLGINDKEIEEAAKFINEIMGTLPGGISSDKDIEEILGISSNEKDDFFEDEEEDITSYDPNIIANNESFGAITYILSENLYEEFKDIYGDGPYELRTFATILGYNLIPAFSTMDSIEYIEHNEKYILFVAKANDEAIEDFVIAAIKSEENVFEFIVPEYGNTFNIENKNAIDKNLDTNMYQERKDSLGNISLALKNPLDMDRVKGSLDLLLYENKKPLLSPHDFGEIFTSPTPSIFNDAFIRIGRIKCNNSKEANLFKMHYDLDEDREFFDFYIRLSDEYPVKTLDAVQKYFEHIDFNKNPKIEEKELKGKNYESVYIDLDLGNLEKFARHWMDKE